MSELRYNPERAFMHVAIENIHDVKEAKDTGESLGIAQNAAERENIEELDRRSLRLLCAIFDNAIDGMFIVNDQLCYIEANPAACKMLRRTREQIVGQQVCSFSAPNSISPEFLEELRQRGEFVSEHRIILPDETHVDVEISIKVGILPGLHLFMLRDVTDRKRLELQFLQSQKMEALGRLAGGVAHDVNNMLMAIRGYGELLLYKCQSLPGANRYTENILNAVDRAALTTKQLLAFSRQQVVQPQRLNLNTVVIEMGKLLQRSIGEDIHLELSLASDLGEIKADPGEIGQVLLNLAVNAKDAMPNGGCLHLQTSNVTLDAGYLKSHLHAKPGEYIVLNVTDTGCGMDADTIARIFEPFFTTKAPGKGTGLGLPTAYGIVKQAGGLIYVYSEPGEGTSFKVYFPRVDTIHPSEHRELTRTRTGSTVLVLDDDPDANQALSDYLREQGCAVLQAYSGQQALAECQRCAERIDVVISDVTMPGTDGQDLRAFLAIHEPDAQIIYISGFSRENLRARGILPDGCKFLQKPFKFEDLRFKLEEALASEHLADSSQTEF